MTAIQDELLIRAGKYCGLECAIKYDVLKSLVDIKSFDSTFNSLLFRGFFVRVNTNDFSNQYKMTEKGMNSLNSLR